MIYHVYKMSTCNTDLGIFESDEASKIVQHLVDTGVVTEKDTWLLFEEVKVIDCNLNHKHPLKKYQCVGEVVYIQIDEIETTQQNRLRSTEKCLGPEKMQELWDYIGREERTAKAELPPIDFD